MLRMVGGQTQGASAGSVGQLQPCRPEPTGTWVSLVTLVGTGAAGVSSSGWAEGQGAWGSGQASQAGLA